MMKSQINQQQTDWLAQAEELSNTEAEQINGGNLSLTERATQLYEQMAATTIEFQALTTAKKLNSKKSKLPKA